jgi:Ca-activated chloride channel family protein
MRTILSILIFFLFISTQLLANGVVIDKSKINSYAKLTQSNIIVNIENQVALVVTSQTFKNNIKDSLSIRYAFPLPEGASATKLRFKIKGQWYYAKFSAVPQDTSKGGGSGGVNDTKLSNYLGANPLYYSIDSTLRMDSSIIVELTYVELLKYKSGTVEFTHPNNYSTLQSTPLTYQTFSFNLISSRSITSALLISHTATQSTINTNTAMIVYNAENINLTNDLKVIYALDLTQLGLSSLSTFTPDSIQKDNYGKGFFAFVVEPNPSTTATVINKVFTLIIDQSGSMSGDKMTQAKDAAKYIVNNLNAGDKFNIISFDSYVYLFRNYHVNYTINSRDSALTFINNLNANSLTNISLAFSTAVPQFAFADTNSANIIIFLTDGQPTEGITDITSLKNHINTLIKNSEKNINLFTFGIGTSINQELLTNIAVNNNGLAVFLDNNQLEAIITDFYNTIRNPVLLGTKIKYLPAVVNEVYPKVLPNLYKGRQMVLIGRYTTPGPVNIELSGKVFNQTTTYNYNTTLIDTNVIKYQFLTKLWAKSKIDFLTTQYYLYKSNITRADSIKSAIVKISLDYGVISIFTSFQGTGGSGGGGGGGTLGIENIINEWNTKNESENEFIKLISINPNPAIDFFNLSFKTKDFTNGELNIKIINSDGNKVYDSNIDVAANNEYQFKINIEELNTTKGIHFILIKFGQKTIVAKLVFI